MENSSNKVWIVTEGCYSDYHYSGIYSSKALAEAVAERVGGDVAEVELNSYRPHPVTYLHINELGYIYARVVWYDDPCEEPVLWRSPRNIIRITLPGRYTLSDENLTIIKSSMVDY